MPVKGKTLYPMRWYWRADIEYCQPVLCDNTKQVPTTTPALPDPPDTSTQTALGSQPVITQD